VFIYNELLIFSALVGIYIYMFYYTQCTVNHLQFNAKQNFRFS